MMDRYRCDAQPQLRQKVGKQLEKVDAGTAPGSVSDYDVAEEVEVDKKQEEESKNSDVNNNKKKKTTEVTMTPRSYYYFDSFYCLRKWRKFPYFHFHSFIQIWKSF